MHSRTNPRHGRSVYKILCLENHSRAHFRDLAKWATILLDKPIKTGQLPCFLVVRTYWIKSSSLLWPESKDRILLCTLTVLIIVGFKTCYSFETTILFKQRKLTVKENKMGTNISIAKKLWRILNKNNFLVFNNIFCFAAIFSMVMLTKVIAKWF